MKLPNWLNNLILDILENKRCPECGCRKRYPIYGTFRDGWRCDGCDYRVNRKL